MENEFARNIATLMAHKLGREPTPEEIDEANKRSQEAVGLSSGVLGTVGNSLKFGKIRDILRGTKGAEPELVEKVAPSFMDRYKQAVANTKVRQLGDTPQPNFGKVVQKTEPTPITPENFSDEDFMALLNRTMGIK